MAGTFSEQATLATDNSFINKCKVAMLFRANQILSDADTNPGYKQMIQMQTIVNNAGGDAPNMAWKVATGNATIAAAAPAVPSDGDTQFAVNTQLDLDIS